MKVAIIEDEWFPFYSLRMPDPRLAPVDLVDVPDALIEEWESVLDRAADLQSKLADYYYHKGGETK